MIAVNTHQRPGELIAHAVKIVRMTGEITHLNPEISLIAVDPIRRIVCKWRAILVHDRKGYALYLMQELIEPILMCQWSH